MQHMTAAQIGKPTHTPGPWVAQWKGLGAIVIGGRGVAVAQMGGENGERMANARLVSAAPDLFAALKRLLQEADDDGITQTGVDEAFAAIQKAGG